MIFQDWWNNEKEKENFEDKSAKEIAQIAWNFVENNFPKPEQTRNGESDIKIVVFQRGFIDIGRFSKSGYNCKLTSSYNIRRWGTEKGLGELAENGPLEDTKLDKQFGLVEFDYLTVIKTIECNGEKWKDKIK